MAREVRIERRGSPGLDAAEKLYVTRDADGERLIPAPTGEALYETLTAPLTSAVNAFQQESGAAFAEFGEVGALAIAGVEEQAQQALARLPGGPLLNGVWVRIPSIYRLRLTGTGTVTINARNSLGVVSPAVATFTVASASNQIEYPYFGDDVAEVRATLTGTATAEII